MHSIIIQHLFPFLKNVYFKSRYVVGYIDVRFWLFFCKKIQNDFIPLEEIPLKLGPRQMCSLSLLPNTALEILSTIKIC